MRAGHPPDPEILRSCEPHPEGQPACGAGNGQAGSNRSSVARNDPRKNQEKGYFSPLAAFRWLAVNAPSMPVRERLM